MRITIAFCPKEAMLELLLASTCHFKHGQSSSEPRSVMILDPIVGNRLEKQETVRKESITNE
jgi:hypothetical protein